MSEELVDEGEALWRQERYQEALEALEQALQVDPGYLRAYNGRTQARARQREW